MDGDVDGACFAAGMVTREGTLEGGEGTKAKVRIWPNMGDLQKLRVGFLLNMKPWVMGYEKRM